MKSSSPCLPALVAVGFLICLSPKLLGAGSKKVIEIDPNQQGDLISWGYDLKQDGRAAAFTPALAKTLFGDNQMILLRIPIFGDHSHPAHPADGQVIGSYYEATLRAIELARKVQPKVRLYASKKLESTTSFPPWVVDDNGVVPEKYAAMIADFLSYVQQRGCPIDVLGIDNETEWNEGKITPQKYKDIVDDITTLSRSRGFILPGAFIAPDSYFPKPEWVKQANQLSSRLDIVGTHYYPERPLGQLRKLASAAAGKTVWHTELHAADVARGRDDAAERTLATFLDCTDLGITTYFWWDYRPQAFAGLEAEIVRSTVNAHPVNTGGSSGKLIIRAFTKGRRIVVWAMTDDVLPTACTVRLSRGTIGGDVSFTRWTLAGIDDGKGSVIPSEAGAFSLELPPGTIAEIIIPYIASNSGP